ncbi:MAG: DUF3343 domain-containing protein [Eggerthellaceae bacterium]|nr:DUF3343 domain-containing protein [Eggerthellaceae bacterium]
MARNAKPHVVATFHTTTAALAMQDAGKRAGLRGRLAPIPRQLSAGCGFAWREPADNEAALRAAIEHAGIEVEALVALDL